MNIRLLAVGAFEENCILAWDDPAKAVIVDPGDETPVILSALRSNGLAPAAVLLTHGHIDHVAALDDLLAAFPGLPVHLHAGDAAWAFTPVNRIPPYLRVPDRPDSLRDVSEGAVLSFGGLDFTVLHTPGHSPGSVCYHLAKEGVLLSGDTLFAGSVGRTDLPGGDTDTELRSLERLMALPDETQVYPGHGPSTTVGRERAFNPFVNR